MNPSDFDLTTLAGLILIVVFVGLMLVFMATGRKTAGRTPFTLREIPAFARFRRAIGLAVEAGQRLHLSFGWGGLNGLQGGSGLLGLSVLARVARMASISDRPPVATSGEGSLAILTQDTLRGAYRSMGAEAQYNPILGQVTGLTPFSYAAGILPLIHEQQTSATFLAGHFGSEVALITDASVRSGSLTLAGSDSVPTQAVLYATAQEPLIGEELYAAGAYLQAGPLHIASLRAQDVIRWGLVVVIVAGAVLKMVGIL